MAVDVKKVIKDMQGDFASSNENQMKGLELMKGIATSDEPISNEFMKKVDIAITKVSKEVLGDKKEEAIVLSKDHYINGKVIKEGTKILFEKAKYELVWKGEVIDSAEDMENAEYLKQEYEMAYGGEVKIKKK